MISWQKILREETYSNDFELIEDNDAYIVDGVVESYKSKITATSSQVKEILDGAFKAGFQLAKRRYSSKVVYVLSKSYKNAHMVIQLSVQPDVLFVCELTYGLHGDELKPTAKKSKYFPIVYDTFDKNLPLEFMNVDVKDQLTDKTHIQVVHEYDWEAYFDYVYSFMVVMLTKLNTEDTEVFLEESVKEAVVKQEETVFDVFFGKLRDFNKNITIQQKHSQKESVVFIEWREGYRDLSDEIKNEVNITIDQFKQELIEQGATVDIHRARSNLYLARTIFIKY